MNNVSTPGLSFLFQINDLIELLIEKHSNQEFEL